MMDVYLISKQIRKWPIKLRWNCMKKRNRRKKTKTQKIHTCQTKNN